MRRPRRNGLLGAAAALLILVGVAVAACGFLAGRSGPPQPTNVSGSPDGAAPAIGRSEPTRVLIPSIGVNAPVTAKGLDADGRLDPPPLSEPQQTGWYKNGPTPGQLGPAVIEGHVDSSKGAAVFYRLGALKQGATVKVERADGSSAMFKVDGMERVAKDAFPTEKVYGDLTYPGLRLITCGGAFDQARRSYTDNIIVYAHLVGS